MHIKAAYLNAIELMRLDDLPSRPFALGFVKTYAEALGVDASAAVAKFKETTGSPSPRRGSIISLQSLSSPLLKSASARY